MKVFHLIFLFFLVGLSVSGKSPIPFVSGFQTARTPEEVGFSQERLSRIDTLINACIKNGMRANTVTFVARHGKVVYHKAFGCMNLETKEPVQLNSIYRNASQTKALTSVGLMMLYEKGKFLLDDPVSKHIPEFKNPTVLLTIDDKDSSYTSRPAKSEITIRQLLSHTSGIPYRNKVYEKANIPEVNSLLPLTIEEVVKKIGKLPLDHDPGEKFTYGLNTDVVGYLIEVLSGMPLDKYMQKELFEPLGMVDSYFYLPKEKERRLVTLYAQDSVNSPIYKSKNISNQTYPYSGAKTYFSGGAGVVGTISDYARFCQMILNEGSFNGKQILGRKTIELMSRNQIGDLEVWADGNKFGLGFEISTPKGLALLPGSENGLNWGGMYNTDYYIDPKEDLILLSYNNMNPVANWDVSRRIRILVYQALVK